MSGGGYIYVNICHIVREANNLAKVMVKHEIHKLHLTQALTIEFIICLSNSKFVYYTCRKHVDSNLTKLELKI